MAKEVKYSTEVKSAIELGESIEETIGEIDEKTVDKHSDFFESVLTKSKSIVATIKKNEAVTDKQHNALDNMLLGVKKWLHDDD